jgi:hypothetical protein
MRLSLVNFAGLTAIAFLQIHGRAGEDVLKAKIIRQTLNHNEGSAPTGDREIAEKNRVAIETATGLMRILGNVLSIA